MSGFRVHVGMRDYPHQTFLLLDVYDVTTPAGAKEKARRCTYDAAKYDNLLWLGVHDSYSCGVEVSEAGNPDALPDDIICYRWQGWSGGVTFICNEDDAL
jgi:hypothetical protein